MHSLLLFSKNHHAQLFQEFTETFKKWNHIILGHFWRITILVETNVLQTNWGKSKYWDAD